MANFANVSSFKIIIMYSGYKVVVNTAAGRRRYMRCLLPFVLSSPIVDRYDIWVNTLDKLDTAFFEELAKVFPKIRLIWQPDGVVNGIASINAFYRECCDEKTIYVKMDDDLVWIQPGFFEAMLDFRLSHPEAFLVSPLVINNALCTYLLQVNGKIKLDKYYSSQCAHPILCFDGRFASELHNWFLDTKLSCGKTQELKMGEMPMAMTRFSINCIIWFGKDLANISGHVEGDDEEFLSCIYPTRLKRGNFINADVLCAHFAFGPQRDSLNEEDILFRYADECRKQVQQGTQDLKVAYEKVESVLDWVEKETVKLLDRPTKYPNSVPRQQSAYKKLGRCLPKRVRAAIRELFPNRVKQYIAEK